MDGFLNMTESNKQKMLNGEYFNPADKALIEERLRAKKLCFEYNQIPPGNLKRKVNLLKTLLKLEGRVFIEPNFFCDYGYNIHLGHNFYANHNLVILDANLVTIGDDVMIGPNCTLSTASHPVQPQGRNSIEFARPITLGNNVWIGANVSVMPGVTIGDNSVIGAGSVVTKDIPANVIAMGTPCNVTKSL